MFNIGDKIVYPMHGAGEIEKKEVKEVLGENHEYFILNVRAQGLKLMIPINNVDNLGLRHIVDKDGVKRALKVLAGDQSDMSDSWNRRYRDNLEKLKTGELLEVAEVLRDLQIRDMDKGLSAGEKKMLVNTKHILASEIALVMDINEKSSIKIIDDAIFNAHGTVEIDE